MMTRHRASQIATPLRITAAVLFVGWLVALVSCWHSCATGACLNPGSVTKAPSCHGHGDTKSPSGTKPDDASCLAKKPISPDRAPSLEIGMALPATWTTTVASIIPTPRDDVRIDFRQHLRHQPVLTPEVCLGPALHSLAPPSSRLS